MGFFSDLFKTAEEKEQERRRQKGVCLSCGCNTTWDSYDNEICLNNSCSSYVPPPTKYGL